MLLVFFNEKTLFQTMLIMSGKLPGPFEINFWSVTDAHGNGFSLPKCTALTLTTSLLRLGSFGYVSGMVAWPLNI